MKLQTIIVPIFAAVLASGCASTDSRDGNNDYGNGSARSNEGYYGVIESIESRPAVNDGNAVAGTVIGGVIGGVAGDQVESERGNDVATVAGAVLISHETGKANGRQDVYFVRVRFDDRSHQTVAQASLDGLRVGDSVRIERNRVRRY